MPRPTHSHPLWPLLGMVLLIGTPLLYLIGYALHSPQIVDCSDRWVGCEASPREMWTWDFREPTQLAVGLGCFIVAAAFVAPWLMQRPSWQRTLSVVFLILGVLTTGFFALLYAMVYSNDCSDDAFLCFGGAGDAAFFGSPGLVTAPVTLLLGLGLAFGDTSRGRWCRVAGVTVVVAGGVATVVAVVVAGVLDSVTG